MRESTLMAQKLLTGGQALVAPSLLAANFTQLKQELEAIQVADALHLDIMDGHFVPNITYGPGLVKQLRPHWNKPMDVHLMVDRPEDWLEAFVQAGADIITFHEEAAVHAHRLIQEIHRQGCLAGIALNPGTPVSLLEDLIPFLDQILLMTVNPGFGGQSYIKEMEGKIRRARQLIEESGRHILLQVDGGIKRDTIGRAAAAGANFFVAGTAVFKAEDPAEEIRILRQRAAEEGYVGRHQATVMF